MQIYNLDIVSIMNRISQICDELQGQEAANGAETNEDDFARNASYLTLLRSIHDKYQAMKRVDLVETNAQLIDVRPLPAPIDLANDFSNDLNRLLRRAYAELGSSASARLTCKLNKFDSDRFLRILDRGEAIMEVIAEQQPIDYPHSSPRVPVVPEGRTGV